MKRTIRLDLNSFRLTDDGVQFFDIAYDHADYRADPVCRWLPTQYVVGQQAVLVSVRDVSPNALRAGTTAKYRLTFDLNGVAGNSNPAIKQTAGWRGTTNDRSVHAHGVVTIRAIRALKNGAVAVTVS